MVLQNKLDGAHAERIQLILRSSRAAVVSPVFKSSYVQQSSEMGHVWQG